MSREAQLRRRIRQLTWVVIIGLVLGGATAIPLVHEVDWLAAATGLDGIMESGAETAPGWALWLARVQAAVHEVDARAPFLFYGTDWLAFAHFVIAIAFAGALRDPVRNRWLFEFGLLACALLVPYALVLGAIRGIPLWWRLLDSLFGVFGFIPLWFCRRWSREIEMGGSGGQGT
jgi:hypothetical protein